MRLIDADKLLGLFIESGQKHGSEHGCKLGENWLLDYNDIKAVIDNAPTIHVCQKYNIEDHFCPTWCEAIKKTSEDLQQTYQKELDKLAKIEQICKDAFSDPETQDINLYRAQALANIYHLFLYEKGE